MYNVHVVSTTKQIKLSLGFLHPTRNVASNYATHKVAVLTPEADSVLSDHCLEAFGKFTDLFPVFSHGKTFVNFEVHAMCIRMQWIPVQAFWQDHRTMCISQVKLKFCSGD